MNNANPSNFSFGDPFAVEILFNTSTKFLCFSFTPTATAPQILTTLKTQHPRFSEHWTFHLYDFESLPFLISSQLEQSKRKSYTGKYSSLASEIAEVSACVYLHDLVLKTGPEIFNVCVFFSFPPNF